LRGFLLGGGGGVDRAAIESGFALTGYFLERDVYSARGLTAPDSRRAYLVELARRG
jgi:hypothetical protein